METIDCIDPEALRAEDGSRPRRNRFIVDTYLEQIKDTPFRLTRNDLDILDLFQTYKYLPSTHIIAFLSLHPQYVKNRLTILRHVAKVIYCPDSSWHAANARYRPAIYQLTQKGHAMLAEHGRTRRIFPTNEEFPHEFGVCLTEASFGLGAKLHPKIKHHDHEAILASKHCPSSTRQSDTPFQIPITFTYHYKLGTKDRHKELETKVKHDGRPFGFTNGRKQVFFPGIEFDRYTESYTSGDHSTITISKKLQACRALAAQDGYHDRYGIPNNYIPWVTISEVRMRSIMREVEKVTNGKGSEMFLFTHMPDFASFAALPPPDGSMLTRNWKRVGYPDFNILKELEA